MIYNRVLLTCVHGGCKRFRQNLEYIVLLFSYVLHPPPVINNELLLFSAEDVCPSYKPHKCTDQSKCYYETDKCDGSSDCRDGSDERGCGK